MIGRAPSGSLSSVAIAALSMLALGTVTRPLAAQKSMMFCDTMPASTAPIIIEALASGMPNLDGVDTITSAAGGIGKSS